MLGHWVCSILIFKHSAVPRNIILTSMIWIQGRLHVSTFPYNYILLKNMDSAEMAFGPNTSHVDTHIFLLYILILLRNFQEIYCAPGKIVSWWQHTLTQTMLGNTRKHCIENIGRFHLKLMMLGFPCEGLTPVKGDD